MITDSFWRRQVVANTEYVLNNGMNGHREEVISFMEGLTPEMKAAVEKEMAVFWHSPMVVTNRSYRWTNGELVEDKR